MSKIKKAGKILTIIGVSLYFIGLSFMVFLSLWFIFLAFWILIIGLFLLFLDSLWIKKNKYKRILFVLLVLFLIFVIDGFIFGYIPKYVYKKAIKEKNESMCEYLSMWDPFTIIPGISYRIAAPQVTFFKKDCYEKIAIAEKDLTLCHKNSFWDSCYIKTAIAAKDESICEKLKEEFMKRTISEEFRVENKMEDCYASLAIVKKDPSLCERLESKKDQDECLERFQRGEIDILYR